MNDIFLPVSQIEFCRYALDLDTNKIFFQKKKKNWTIAYNKYPLIFYEKSIHTS